MAAVQQTWVKLDGRRFIVVYGGAGEPWIIKERKLLKPPHVGVYDHAFWNVKHHTANPGTLPARILEAAKAKNAAAP